MWLYAVLNRGARVDCGLGHGRDHSLDRPGISDLCAVVGACSRQQKLLLLLRFSEKFKKQTATIF